METEDISAGAGSSVLVTKLLSQEQLWCSKHLNTLKFWAQKHKKPEIRVRSESGLVTNLPRRWSRIYAGRAVVLCWGKQAGSFEKERLLAFS